MLLDIKKLTRNLKNKCFLKKWVSRSDGDHKGKYYIKRHFENNVSYYDLYWYIKSKAENKHVDTLYLRADVNLLIRIIKDAEKTELPMLLEKIHGGGGENVDSPHADGKSR